MQIEGGPSGPTQVNSPSFAGSTHSFSSMSSASNLNPFQAAEDLLRMFDTARASASCVPSNLLLEALETVINTQEMGLSLEVVHAVLMHKPTPRCGNEVIDAAQSASCLGGRAAIDSWKEWACRSTGEETYQFGDVVRGLFSWMSGTRQKENRQADEVWDLLRNRFRLSDEYAGRVICSRARFTSVVAAQVRENPGLEWSERAIQVGIDRFAVEQDEINEVVVCLQKIVESCRMVSDNVLEIAIASLNLKLDLGMSSEELSTTVRQFRVAQGQIECSDYSVSASPSLSEGLRENVIEVVGFPRIDDDAVIALPPRLDENVVEFREQPVRFKGVGVVGRRSVVDDCSPVTVMGIEPIYPNAVG